MNVKYYMRGMGVGLVVASAALMVTDAVTGNTTVQLENAAQQTTSAVIAFTTAPETTQAVEVTTETETSTEQTSIESTVQETTQAVTQPATEQTTEATTAAQTQAATIATSSANADGTVNVNIHNVYYATQASAILLEAGVITDAQSFTDYLVSNGYASRIREGVYAIAPNASFETIARTITQTR